MIREYVLKKELIEWEYEKMSLASEIEYSNAGEESILSLVRDYYQSEDVIKVIKLLLSGGG